jgi:hypothetical protein
LLNFLVKEISFYLGCGVKHSPLLPQKKFEDWREYSSPKVS